VYRAINTIANNMVQIPIRAGALPNGAFRTTAPLAQLLGPPPGSPNPLWSPAMLLRYAIIQYLVTGKFAWAIERRPGSDQIVGLWPIPVQYLKPVMPEPDSTKPEYFESFDLYTRGSINYVSYKPQDIVYCWRPSLSDPRQPESPLNVAKSEINVMWLLGQFDQAFLQNGGVPSHLIVTSPFVDDAERGAFRNQFNRKFGGVSNAGKPMFAERELDLGDGGPGGGSVGDPVSVTKIGQSQRDSEMSNLRSAKIGDLSVGLGVPLSVLGDTRDAKFENIEGDRKIFYRETIRPMLREFEDMLNIHLAPLLGNDVCWFDITKVYELKPIPLFSERWGPTLVESGIITRDEYRDDLGLPPLTAAQRDEIDAAGNPLVEDIPAPGTELPAKPKLVPLPGMGALNTGLKPKASPAGVVPPGYKIGPKSPQGAPPKAALAQSQPMIAVAHRVSHTKGVRDGLIDILVIDLAHAVEQRANSRRNRSLVDVPYWTNRFRTVLSTVVDDPRTLGRCTHTAIELVVRAVADGKMLDGDVTQRIVEIYDGYDSSVPLAGLGQILGQMRAGTMDQDRALNIIKGGAA
jgi:HK97 family phage portal protein